MLKSFSKKTLVFFSLVIVLLFIISPLATYAVKNLETTYPSAPGQKSITVDTSLPEYVRYIFNFAISLSGILFLAILVRGGFLYFTSMGNASQLLEAKEVLKSAFLGIIILLSSYLILFTINPDFIKLSFPPLDVFENIFDDHNIEIELDQSSSISQKLPLGRSIEDGVWNQEYINKTKEVITNLENFLKQKITVDDPDLIKNKNLNGIADLNKYLSTVTHDCRASNLRALGSTPQTGCLAIGCTGDPCQIDQDSEIEEDSPRAKINKIKPLNGKIINELIEHQKLINKQRDTLKEELRKFQSIEGGISACLNQKKELISLNQYLVELQINDDLGIESLETSSYFSSQQNNLSFYCSNGGTIYDPAYTYDSSIDSDIYDPSDVPIEIDTESVFTDSSLEVIMSCPREIKVGETIDQLRELAIIEIFQLDLISSLNEKLAKEIQGMMELVSQCNDSRATINSGCMPNYCFGFCSPLPLPNCIPSCRSLCTQCIKGCSGEACPTEEIIASSEKIKEIESKILKATEEIKLIAPKVKIALNKLNGLDSNIGRCLSTDPLNPDLTLLDCSSAKGNYGPGGAKIGSCNPRSFFCCSSTTSIPIANTSFSYLYASPNKSFPLLKTGSDNCPEGWLCSKDVKYYDQYNKDASEPIKELLSCMRVGLDSVQKKKKLEEVIGKIHAISDPNINKGLCSWSLGPTKAGSCSYNYETAYGKEEISAHYGGLYCKYESKSYAVDIEISNDFQREHLSDIIEVAKKCSQEAYVLYKSPQHLHIDLGAVNQCGSTE